MPILLLERISNRFIIKFQISFTLEGNHPVYLDRQADPSGVHVGLDREWGLAELNAVIDGMPDGRHFFIMGRITSALVAGAEDQDHCLDFADCLAASGVDLGSVPEFAGFRERRLYHIVHGVKHGPKGSG
jgi:hypothetical protein